jgi:hypothetical protein
VPDLLLLVNQTNGFSIRAGASEQRDTATWEVMTWLASGKDWEPFAGKVIWTSVVMGRKTVRGKDPAEKSDRDVLETLILPERTAARLPIGLRVVVEFLGN